MNIVLSGFYNYFYQNQKLIENFALAPNINIAGAAGSFPFSFFSTGINDNSRNKICFYPNMVGCLDKYTFVELVILNFDDPAIDPKDYHNNYLKVQFESFSGNDNIYFSIGDLKFLEYIYKTYPKAKIILADSCFKNFDKKDILATIKNCKNIKGLISTNLDVLETYDLPIKIYQADFYGCAFCNHYQQCKNVDLIHKKEFSLLSKFLECPNAKLLSWDSVIENLKEPISKDYYILFDEPKKDVDEYFSYLLTNLSKEHNYD